MANGELIDALLGLRRVQSPEEMPMSVLTRWRIFRAFHCDAESDHFVGRNADNERMRVSTDIVKFDAQGLAGATQSGRMYKLQGPPAAGEDVERAEAAFARLALSYVVTDIRDVTDAVLASPTSQIHFMH